MLVSVNLENNVKIEPLCHSNQQSEHLYVDFNRGILIIVILFFNYTNCSKIINYYNAYNLQ